VKPFKAIAIITLSLVAVFFCIMAFDDFVFAKRKVFNAVVRLLDGSDLEVEIIEIKKGLFISGGHGWSLGSHRRTYKLNYSFNEERINWEGPGIPIILQRYGDTYFLATFDRDTDFPHTDFLCYQWNRDWKLIPTHKFPKKLAASNNLIRLDTASSSSDQSEFASSFLVRFWYCIDQQVPEWKIAGSDLTNPFVESFRRKMQ
jgi:hypothetical protein